jgi:hypothetical protein
VSSSQVGRCFRINRALTVGVSIRFGDAKVFKKYSQMKLHMKREALEKKMNRQANEMALDSGTGMVQ